jgi:hypothetical protein
MGSARLRTDAGARLTADLKTLIDEDTKEELARLARSEGMNLSEYVRELIMIHVHGREHLIRLTKARLERMVGVRPDEDE